MCCFVRCILAILYTGQCPPQGTSLEVSLPPYAPSSHAPLPHSVAPFLLRSLPPSLRPCLGSFLTRSLPPLPLPPSLTSSLPYSLPPSPCSLPPSPCSLPPSPCSLPPRPAVTFSERAPTTNPFLTKSEKSDDRHVQRIRRKHGRHSYLSVGVGGDSQSLLEREPTRSKDRGLLSYNIDIQCKGIILKGLLNTRSPKNK